jgi:centromere/kinetochore protein ZW10
VLHFIGERLFPALPPAHVPAFAQSLAGPLSAALRDQLLVPGLPTDANELPTYLALAQDAVALEASFLKTVHGDEDDAPAPETPVAAWVAHVGAHYARARRVAVLSSARTTILSSASDPGATFSAPLLVRKTVTEAAAPPGPSIVAVQGEIGASPASARRHPTGAVSNAGSEDAWGLGEDESGPVANGHSDASTAENVEEASWGLDEDEDVSVETVPAMVSTLADSAEEVKNGGHAKAVKEPDGEDPDAAWGWTDDETAVDDMGSADTANVDKATLTTKPGEDEAAQEVEISDDPWDDDPWGAPEPPLAAPATPTPVPAMPASAPPIVPPASAAPTTTTPVKRARRLERLANKSRTTASAGTTPVERPPSQLPLPTHEHPHVAVTAPPTQTRFTTSELRPPAALAPEVVPPTGVAARKPAPPAVRTAPEPVGLVTVTREVELQESYAVSERARAVIALVRSTLDEGASLDVSSVLAAAARSEGASPGETIAMSAAAMLDLWRALAFVQLRPATAPHVKGTVKNLDATIRLANDALYMATAVADVLQAQGTGRASDASATLSESAAGMKVMAEQRYDDALVRHIRRCCCMWKITAHLYLQADQEQAIDDILADADGFNGTDDQTVYDAAEDAVSRCMRHVRSIAHAWKVRTCSGWPCTHSPATACPDFDEQDSILCCAWAARRQGPVACDERSTHAGRHHRPGIPTACRVMPDPGRTSGPVCRI